MSIDCTHQFKTAIVILYPDFNIPISNNKDLDLTYFFMIFLEHDYTLWVFAFGIPYEDYKSPKFSFFQFKIRQTTVW